MTDQEREKSAAERPEFPYRILWAGYGNTKVTLRDLEDHEDEFRVFNEYAPHASGMPSISIGQLTEVRRQFQLSSDAAQKIWLVCAYYLAPRQGAALGLDPKTSRKALERAAFAADRLDRALGSLAPKVIAAMYYIRPFAKDLATPKGPDFWVLQNEAADFAKVAREVAEDLRSVEGRPRNHERDTMLRLLLEIAEGETLNDLSVSTGTRDRPFPHLKGRAGDFIREVVRLVEPDWSEQWLATQLKAVRAKSRRSERAGGKTRGD